MNEMIKRLETKIETNKLFTYMVIHDLKHPTDSLIDCLGTLKLTISGLQSDSKTIGRQTVNMVELIRASSPSNLVSRNSLGPGLSGFRNSGPVRQGPLEESKESP